MWLVVLTQAALACSTSDSVGTFDDWVDGAVDVPTDARIVMVGYTMAPVTLTRVDTGEVVATEGSWEALEALAWPWRIAYTPAAELAPSTTYRADVADPAGDAAPVTFTTGPGPTSDGFAAPVLSEMGHTAWEATDAYECTLGNPLVARRVSGTLDVPDGLPPGSYVALRTESKQATFGYVAAAADGAFDSLQAEFEDAPEADLAAHDCLTPVLILPSGTEVVGETTCIEEAHGLKGGCATGGLGASWALALAALGLVRRGRR